MHERVELAARQPREREHAAAVEGRALGRVDVVVGEVAALQQPPARDDRRGLGEARRERAPDVPLGRVPGPAAVGRAIDAERRADEQRAGRVERLREEARRAACRRNGAVLVDRAARSRRAARRRRRGRCRRALRTPAASARAAPCACRRRREQAAGRPGGLRRELAVADLLPVSRACRSPSRPRARRRRRPPRRRLRAAASSRRPAPRPARTRSRRARGLAGVAQARGERGEELGGGRHVGTLPTWPAPQPLPSACPSPPTTRPTA